MSHFYAYMAKLKHIRRWGLMRNACPENVAEHSLQVAMIAHSLCIWHNREFVTEQQPAVNPERAATLALYHEAAEAITGDLATPVKYFSPEIRTAYRAIEDIASEKLLKMVPEALRSEFTSLLISPESESEWPFVKAADRICAYLKCVEEQRAGNREFDKALLAIQTSLADLDLPAAHAFLRECAPSFALTLDELN